MSQSHAQLSTWYRATTLVERCDSFAAFGPDVPSGSVDLDLARRRLQRWRSQFPFATDSLFAQRLATDGIDESRFLQLLGESVETIASRFAESPAWLVELTNELSSSSPGTPIFSWASPGQEMTGFLEIAEPFLCHGIDRLRAGTESLAQGKDSLPFDPGTIASLLFAGFPQQLFAMLCRTMVLELNVARVLGQLWGASAEQRFESFIQRLRERDTATAILQEYSVLSRQIVLCIHQWVEFGLEFLNHLIADWEAIRATFHPDGDPGLLSYVEAHGDRHRGGRAVLVAKFTSGFQLVYKPKSLAVDVHFQELLAWLNARGAQPSFRTIKVLDRGRYGWTEFVAPQTCGRPEQVRSFYERQGGYLALLYVLQATDTHFENLIAAGEHPVLIDLESLFHPYISDWDIAKSEVRVGLAMAHSVLRVGLLPRREWADDESEGVEMSGLGASAGQLTPSSVPHFESAGTDGMRVVRKRVPMQEGRNRPTLNGAHVDALENADSLAKGFTEVYRLIMKHRNELAAAGGPLARFAEDEVRAILRPTRVYGLLLQESFHPDVLRDAMDRDQLFDRLWVAVPDAPHLIQVIPAEREALWQGDIPIFTTRPNSCGLWCSASECIPDFFAESGLTAAQRCLDGLGEDDLARQLWFLRASLTTLAMDAGHSSPRGYRPVEPQALATQEQFLTAAGAIGDKLGMLALRGAEVEDATWIGLKLVNEKHWALLPLGLDLYGGVPGVALFLAYLGAVSQEQHFTGLAQAALITVRRQIESSKDLINSIGGFSGWGSVIYVLTHLGVLWKQATLHAEAESLVELLETFIAKDDQFDVLNGSAGCIISLLQFHHCTRSERALAAAVECGDRLVREARPAAQGVAWTSKGSSAQPLAGFSHGAAGIAWALLELAASTGKRHYRETALAAINYERALFSREAQNWPDLRDFEKMDHLRDDGAEKFMIAWCHGAPGIGLARLCSLPYLDDAAIRAEIGVALRTTLMQGFGSNHSLCHGDLGNVDLLLQAGQILGDPQWNHHTTRIGSMILQSIREHGWLCGVPLSVETPGLMTGLAGIGYGLLRLADPARVPSVLTLEPPRGQQAVGHDSIDRGIADPTSHDAALCALMEESTAVKTNQRTWRRA